MAEFLTLMLVGVVALAICQFASIDPVVAIKSVLPMLGVGRALSSKVVSPLSLGWYRRTWVHNQRGI